MPGPESLWFIGKPLLERNLKSWDLTYCFSHTKEISHELANIKDPYKAKSLPVHVYFCIRQSLALLALTIPPAFVRSEANFALPNSWANISGSSLQLKSARGVYSNDQIFSNSIDSTQPGRKNKLPLFKPIARNCYKEDKISSSSSDQDQATDQKVIFITRRTEAFVWTMMHLFS